MPYIFNKIENCNMCGDPSTSQKILGKRLNHSQGLRPNKKIGITTTVVKCRSCGLVFANPMPVPMNLGEHYEVEPETYWKERYFQEEANYFKAQIETFWSMFNSDHKPAALDIGAGLGKCLVALEKAGMDVYGIEPSKFFYERALDLTGIAKDRLILTSFEDAEFDYNSFDLITFKAVLEHLYNPSSSIEKALKWLKPNGLIHIEVPSTSWLTAKIANLIYRIQGLDYVANISPMHPPFHLYEFGIESFRKNAVINHYEIAKYNYLVCSTYLPRILNPFVIRIMRLTNTGMQLEIWLRKKYSVRSHE